MIPHFAMRNFVAAVDNTIIVMAGFRITVKDTAAITEAMDIASVIRHTSFTKGRKLKG